MRKIISAFLFMVLFCSCVSGAEVVSSDLDSTSNVKTFSDVSETAWYYNTVSEMTAEGILSGYPDGSFKPQNPITCGEFLTVIGKMKGLSASSDSPSPYAKAALSAGYYDYDEIPPTGEKYKSPIERQLAVKIVVKAFAEGDLSYDYNLESSKISDFPSLSGRYYDTVLYAYKAGLVNGDEKGAFKPTSPLTRAEACTLIKNTADKFGTAAPEITEAYTEAETEISASASDKGVSQNGSLKVVGTQLCNEKGEAIILRGMSSHGLHWFPRFVKEDYVKAVKDAGANVMRFAMYTSEGGYIQNKGIKDTLYSGVDTALKNDMYAIIDWHILYDGDPITHLEEAKVFFAEAAEKYKDKKGVIYEICNEPNGNITWSENVKPYAEAVIPIIREKDPDAVILVGCPVWCQDLESVSSNKLNFDNIMYTCHFYAGTHTDWLRARISKVTAAGVPVFVSEWGTSKADGSGGVFKEESEKWLDFMSKNKISWCNWSLCDKEETSAAVTKTADPKDGLAQDELTDSGKIVFSHFND